MKTILLILLSISPLSTLFSQTGPGGVGNAASNNMWLSGDFGTFTNAGVTPATSGQAIQQWNDRSGNNRNATQLTLGNRPTLKLNSANGMNGLRFTGNLFIDGPSPGIVGTSSYTYFVNFRDTTTVLGAINDANGSFILDRTAPTNELVSLKPVTGSLYCYQKRSTSNSGINTSPVSTTTINTNTKTIEMRRNFNVDYQIIYNNVIQGTEINNFDGATPPPAPRIGRHATIAGNGISGYINEFIIYNFALNTAQTLIVNNYLSAKYGFTLNARDIYIQDNPAHGNFDFEVAGIGRVDASNIHNDAQGSAIVRINNPTNLTDNKFLIWGHNNLLQQATQTVDVPAGVQARFQRVWRNNQVDNVGTAVNVGSIDFTWDLTNLNTVTASDLRLLIDFNNNGIFADDVPIAGAVNVGGNNYRFAGVATLGNDMRFTLGTINIAQTPLPITLLNFDATPKDRSVLLDWATATEINNDYFTIEKSQDGENWNVFEIVNGAGNSQTTISYSTIDNYPFKGLSYYRLKQTDFDGQSMYSGLRSVYFAPASSGLNIYPNPTEEYIVLDGDFSTEGKVEILSLDGKNVSGNCTVIQSSDERLVLDLSSLSDGIYILVHDADTYKIVKR